MPQWYKGNIHTHTTESDGDDKPENVVRWYRVMSSTSSSRADPAAEAAGA